MIYLLDTNTCIGYLNGRSVSVLQQLRSLTPADVAVCSVVKAELFYGAMRSRNPTRTLIQQQQFLNQFVSLPFDDQAAFVCGRLRAQLATAGTPIGSNDMLIASIAIAYDLVLVTHNVREFSRIDGLRFENWERVE